MLASQNASPRAALLVSLLALAGSVVGQLAAPNCQAGWEWSFNSLGQNPCTVAAYLEATCNGGQFVIAPLQPDHEYTGPSGPDDGDMCKCNTVAYSLISACDACQGAAWIQWSEWSLNCTSVAPPSTFPEAIPSGTRVPHWAYLDVVSADTWNNASAFADGSSSAPESTGSGAPTSVHPTSSATSPSTPTSATSVGGGGSFPASASATPSHTASAGHSSNTGAIAGGVVGGVVGLALIGGLIVWLVRSRRGRPRPSSDYGAQPQMQQGTYSMPVPFIATPPETPQKYYDPTDPSTFPSAAPSPTIHTTTTDPYQNSFSSLQPNRQYNGLPEV
ncbi:hypothetical protein BV25DRAFT_1989821 [Artomyces pyxidatus]|uniref:Uncharacterized protein n=1 Tax=Artomyces pyxidatus TaxID=48021 RepID=A0ACB8T8P6_9AGAM|nr:hypothetical protein BV25DRAFT_1989821 [Artomyces pyxidatus]